MQYGGDGHQPVGLFKSEVGNVAIWSRLNQAEISFPSPTHILVVWLRYISSSNAEKVSVWGGQKAGRSDRGPYHLDGPVTVIVEHYALQILSGHTAVHPGLVT